MEFVNKADRTKSSSANIHVKVCGNPSKAINITQTFQVSSTTKYVNLNGYVNSSNCTVTAKLIVLIEGAQFNADEIYINSDNS